MTSGTSTLDDLIARIGVMSPAEVDAAVKGAQAIIAADGVMPKWIPLPGPQTEAFFCQADELFYGGEAGGAKTQLILGLALTQHRRSLLLRRFRDDALALADMMAEILGNRDGLNSQILDWRIPGTNKMVEFGGCQHEDDKQRYKGKPHDLIAFDEGSDFTKSMYDFICAWNRSEDPDQRCRIVVASNPPTSGEGAWVIEHWAAWLDDTHPNPAKPGELRWYVQPMEGPNIEVSGPGIHKIGDENLRATSRTFIRARLQDNPYYSRTDYAAKLDRLPPELRAAYRDGNFMAMRKDQPMQIIPTAWVRAAQARWTPERPNLPMTAIGADVAQGGKDRSVVAARHDWWYAPLVVQPGKDTPSGREIVGMVVPHRRDNATVVLDSGGGFAGGAYEILRDNLDRKELILFKGNEQSSRRTRDKKFGFTNDRTAALWGFREALDPEQPDGSPIALPPDQELLAELTAPTYEYTARGIKAEDAEDVADRLGRSPDKAVAVILAWWSGAKLLHTGQSDFTDEKRHGRPMGRSRGGQEFQVQLRKPRAA